MARKRMIDPEFWSDEEIGKWPHSARLFYIALWNFADDEGRFKADNRLLLSQIYPYDDPKRVKIELYKELISTKCVFYEVNGLKYGYLKNFLKYQRINKPYPSKLPPPPDPEIINHSGNTTGTLPPKIKEEKRRENNRSEEKRMQGEEEQAPSEPCAIKGAGSLAKKKVEKQSMWETDSDLKTLLQKVQETFELKALLKMYEKKKYIFNLFWLQSICESYLAMDPKPENKTVYFVNLLEADIKAPVPEVSQPEEDPEMVPPGDEQT